MFLAPYNHLSNDFGKQSILTVGRCYIKLLAEWQMVDPDQTAPLDKGLHDLMCMGSG